MPVLEITSAIKANYKRVYLLGLALLLTGLPLSKFLMSAAQFILIAGWLLDGNLKNKFSSFFKNKIALALSALFFIHLAGLTYTSDFQYGLEDVKKKIPLLLLPLIIFTSPKILLKEFNLLLGIFIGAVLASMLVTTAVLLGFTHHHIVDVRQASLFVSHIRLSLMVCLSFFITSYWLFKASGIKKAVAAVLSLWFVVFLSMIGWATGLLILAFVLYLILVRVFIREKRGLLKYSVLAVLLAAPTLSALYVVREARQYYSVKEFPIEEKSASGEAYFHDTSRKDYENGFPVWSNIAWGELEAGWNSRSKINFSQRDAKGNELKYTLLRFLTSKGLKKDGEAVNRLSEEEISRIEGGVANAEYDDILSLNDRLHAIIYEVDNYRKEEVPNGHSVTMRLEFWKAAIGIVKANLLFGVGTGDVKAEFARQYERINSPLEERWRLRAHNQFLEVAVALGVAGLVIFLVSLLYPLYASRKKLHYFYAVFFAIAILSMLTEDTLETQAGVTFFALFNSLFLFSELKKKQEIIMKKATPLPAEEPAASYI